MGQRKHDQALTRAKIFKAAHRCFEAHGYETALLREIAGLAGVSTGAIFANFANKAALYQAIYGHAPLTPEGGRALIAALRAIEGHALVLHSGFGSMIAGLAHDAIIEAAV